MLYMVYDLILTASYDHSICIWSLNGQGLKLMQTVNEHNDGVWDLQRDLVGPDQPWIVSAGMDGLVLLLKYDDEKVAVDIVSKWHIEKEEFTCVQLCSRLGLIASGGDTGQVHVLNFNIKSDKRILKHRHGISGLQFVPRSSSSIDLELLLTAGHDSKLRLWNIENDTCLAMISGHRDAIRTLDSSFTR